MLKSLSKDMNQTLRINKGQGTCGTARRDPHTPRCWASSSHPSGIAVVSIDADPEDPEDPAGPDAAGLGTGGGVGGSGVGGFGGGGGNVGCFGTMMFLGCLAGAERAATSLAAALAG